MSSVDGEVGAVARLTMTLSHFLVRFWPRSQTVIGRPSGTLRGKSSDALHRPNRAASQPTAVGHRWVRGTRDTTAWSTFDDAWVRDPAAPTAPTPARGLPARPIALREVAAALGERVFLVGCEYRHPRCTQTVVGGRVTGRNAGRLRLALDHPVVLRGYSGAPIVDANGHAVGVLSTSAGFDLPDESSAEAEGSNATHALGLLISPSTR